MVNASLNWASFVGIALAASGAGLYALRSLRPRLARDHDIFFAAIALLCGGILFFQGWRLDPILQFNQFLLAGTAIFFAYESIRLRGAATEQAKRNTPIVDDERPVSRVYRADLEELNPYEDRPAARRIRGSRDVRSERDEYEEESRRRSTSRTGEARLGTGAGDRTRKRRPRSTDASIDAPSSREDSDVWDDKPARSRSTSPSRSGNQPPTSASRPRRSRPAADDVSPRDRRDVRNGSSSSEYVDYRPVDVDEEDNWGNY
ncbi:MAG: Ycf66 family protein [Stenomitos frigidus ULC029]